MVFTGTSGNLSVALYIASLIEMGTGNHLSRVKIAALAWGVNIFSGIVNTIGTRAIGAVSSFNVWFTLAGTSRFLLELFGLGAYIKLWIGTVILTVVLLVKAPVKVPRRIHFHHMITTDVIWGRTPHISLFSTTRTSPE